MNERRVAKALIDAGLRRGYTVSVQDGEEWTVQRSRDGEQARQALFSTGEDRVLFRDTTGRQVAIFLLIGGNAPDELIADYGDNLVANAIYREVMAACGFHDLAQAGGIA